MTVVLMASYAFGGQAVTAYRLERGPVDVTEIRLRFTDAELEILEALNRAGRDHLPRLRQLVVPRRWRADLLAHSPIPANYDSGRSTPKLLVLHLPGQMFGAYEFGVLVRWGPLSSGSRGSQTPSGLFHLNWRSTGRTSTVDPDWFMSWYFNFDNLEGLSLHQYSLPGRPASHGCVRLLERDAEWLFGWGVEWTLDAGGTRIVQNGTPVFIVGAYDFDASPPWNSLEWLERRVELPPLPAIDQGS